MSDGEAARKCIFIISLPAKKINERWAYSIIETFRQLFPQARAHYMWELDNHKITEKKEPSASVVKP